MTYYTCIIFFWDDSHMKIFILKWLQQEFLLSSAGDPISTIVTEQSWWVQWPLHTEKPKSEELVFVAKRFIYPVAKGGEQAQFSRHELKLKQNVKDNGEKKLYIFTNFKSGVLIGQLETMSSKVSNGKGERKNNGMPS